ncbi:hypothetical protein OHT77_01130 [Streptomyces sp. NBC_00252]|nr:hypothetical protein [Streptomyces sp. NBC_00252]
MEQMLDVVPTRRSSWPGVATVTVGLKGMPGMRIVSRLPTRAVPSAAEKVLHSP